MKNVIYAKILIPWHYCNVAWKRHARAGSEITARDRRAEDQHSARMIITPSGNPFCPQESYWIITYFFHVIP